ncbi:MAG: FliM/FliN family flagellar motor switch protein [Pseudomonadota bacterium]
MTDDTETGHPFTKVPIEITVSIGKARPKVKELLSLDDDSVLVLDKKVEDPVELYVGDKLIGYGELQEMDGDDTGRLAVRLTDIADISNGL